MYLPTVQPLLHEVLSLVKSPITMCGKCVWPSAGSENLSFGDLYTECTASPDITIVISTTVPCTLS